MNTLICPLPAFQRLLRALAEDRRRVAFARVGTHSAPPDREWLVRDFILSPSGTPAPQQDLVFRVALTSNPPAIPLTPSSLDPLPPAVVGSLSLGDGPWRAHLWGVVRTDDIIEPLHHLFLVGAGMHTVHILTPYDQDPSPHSQHRLISSYQTRWSRTIGALGGEDIWQRLVRLPIAIIGCGRTGSVVAVTLARLGIRQLTLIDPDIVETHNLGEMDVVTQADVGHSKAQALAACLRKEREEPGNTEFFSSLAADIRAIPASVTSESALAACKDADVLFCCVDSDAARLATALIATLYHAVLIDIGTGVHFPATNERIHDPQSVLRHRVMGADVRMILPGDGCLLCVGNLSRYQQAVEELCHGGPLPSQPQEWWQQRAGSLRTLNHIAAHVGVQMLQDLVAERIRESLWARIEFDDTGRMTVHYPPTQRPSDSPPCALCAKAGLGDEGLSWMQPS